MSMLRLTRGVSCETSCGRLCEFGDGGGGLLQDGGDVVAVWGEEERGRG